MLRVLHQPMKPLEPRALDPGRAVTNGSGMKIKGSSDPDHERDLKRFNVSGHEPLLLWGAQAHPEDVRSAFAHLGENLPFLIRKQASEGRRVCPDHLQAGKLFLKCFAQPVGHTRFTAVKKGAVAALD